MIKTLIIAASIAFLPDTVLVPAVLVSAKQPLPDAKRAGPVAVFRIEESDRMISPKSLSTQVPGLFLPDYGSSMTSTIYHRGFGSRMENPVIGVYVDRIPILDKNAYDIDFLDVDDLRFYGGAQGTLYGRNSMGGVLEVKTLSPSRFKGIRGKVEGGSGGVFSSRIAAYGTHRAVCRQTSPSARLQ